MNGMLSRAEFAQISNGTMSPLFIQARSAAAAPTRHHAASDACLSPVQRIFEEHVMRRRSFMHAHRASSYRWRPRAGQPASSSMHALHVCARRDEMDLISFTDFVLAWDHRSHPAAIKYFFPIMDLQMKV